MIVLPLPLILPVDHIEGVADSLCVGQWYLGDERVILFLKIAPGYR